MDLETVRKWIEAGVYDRPVSDVPGCEEVRFAAKNMHT
jgi:hypothetical protein